MTDPTDELPLLTEVTEYATALELPVLFEVVEPVEKKPVRALNAEEMQQLLQELESHLETVFADKLNRQLEELQRLAVDFAISEFKAELPKLLREALSHTASGKW